MDSDQQQQFRDYYQRGLEAFEQGRYRLSVQSWEKAAEIPPPATRLGGEIRIWLVTAYQADGKVQEAIALCRYLTRHPHPEIRKQAQGLLYILEAPQLKRPQEWMTQIPDLGQASETAQYVKSGGSGGKNPQKSKLVLEPVGMESVEGKENRFVWVAFAVFLLILGGAIWLS